MYFVRSASFYIFVHPLTVCVPAISVSRIRLTSTVHKTISFSINFFNYRFVFVFRSGFKRCLASRSATTTLLCTIDDWMPFHSLSFKYKYNIFFLFFYLLSNQTQNLYSLNWLIEFVSFYKQITTKKIEKSLIRSNRIKQWIIFRCNSIRWFQKRIKEKKSQLDNFQIVDCFYFFFSCIFFY